MTVRSRRTATLLSLVGFLLSGLAFMAPAAQADDEPVDLSTVAAMKAYLDSKGFDSSTALVQEAGDNYAGPTCPGGTFTCATPTPGQVVIQRTTAGGTNIFESGDSSCVVVQASEDLDNYASCTQFSSVDGSFRASITQQTVNGLNSASVDQSASEYAGDTQTFAHAADIHQQIGGEGNGTNSSGIYQNIYQEASGVGPVTQTQTGAEHADLDQFSASGDNSLTLDQYLTQYATATGSSGIVQYQNASGTEQYVTNDVNQNSDTGANDSAVFVETNQDAVVNPSPSEAAAAPGSFAASSVDAAATQAQGCEDCGILGSLNQSSTGLSTATAEFVELQDLEANEVASVAQTQYGPVGVPPNHMPDVPAPVNGVRCCANQVGNPYDFLSITINSEQTAGPDAVRFNYVLGSCLTEGTCSASTTVTQDALTTAESCLGGDCNIAVRCTQADGCATGDNAEPETTLINGPPSASTSESATFEFASNETGGFICALDEADWETCSSPKTYPALIDGPHLFRVSAVDLAGNLDQSPAELVWSISAAPDTIIDSAPPDFTNSSEATITFHATEAATFECKLDANPFAGCASPQTYTGLGAGTHYVQVRARDALGNVDPTPDSVAWIIDFTVPTSTFTTRDGAVKIGSPPGNGTVDGTARDDVSGIDHVLVEFTTLGITRRRNATITCNLNRTRCTWQAGVFGLPPGRYTVTKKAFDRAGNSDSSTLISIWVV